MQTEAPAKLNLSLRVVGRRPDGHHLLDSEFVLLELADRLLLLEGCSGLRIDGEREPDLPLGPDNLAWRGLLAGLGGEPELVCLALEKRIPAAAGLGGGSSDAAAAWRLGRAWRGVREPAATRELEELSRIGADVPFFAAGTVRARVTGIGEQIEPMTPLDSLVLLVHPPFGLSTAAIFAELLRDEWGRSDGNDLLAPALRLRPELAAVLDVVRRAGGEPRLTGSGPTVFSLSDDPDRVRSVAERIAAHGLRATMTRTRTQAPQIEASPQEDE